MDVRKNKGLSLIEIIVAISASIIVILAFSSLFTFHAKMLKDTTSTSEKTTKLASVIYHLLNNIQDSAWVTLDDANTLHLHSHSSPVMRTYKYENNKLLYYEHTEPFDTITNGGVELVAGIGAAEMFKTEGEELPSGRFRELTIELWQKSTDSKPDDTEDVFYLKRHITCKQSADTIYIDPDNSGDIKDGTRKFPLDMLEDGLSMFSEPEVAYLDLPYPRGVLFVQSGSHTITGQTTFLPSVAIFGSLSQLTIEPGSRVTMSDTSLSMRGGFECNGTPEAKITLDYKHSAIGYGTGYGNDRRSWSRWSIYVVNNDTDYVFTNLILKWPDNGIAINSYSEPRLCRPVATEFDVDISYNYSEYGYTHYNIDGAKNCTIYNNNIKNGYVFLGGILTPDNWENITSSVNHNTFSNAELYLRFLSYVRGLYSAKIYNNIFDNHDYHRGNIAIHNVGAKSQIDVYNNYLTPGGPTSTFLNGIYIANSAIPTEEAKINIYNNTIQSQYKTDCGILASFCRVPIYVRNNIFTFNRQVNSGAGCSLATYDVKDESMHFLVEISKSLRIDYHSIPGVV